MTLELTGSSESNDSSIGSMIVWSLLRMAYNKHDKETQQSREQRDSPTYLIRVRRAISFLLSSWIESA